MLATPAYSRFDNANDSRSSSIAMFTVFSVTSAGTCSWIGAKLMIPDDARGHDLIDHPLRRRRGYRDHRDVHRALAIVLGERVDRAHREAVDLAPDLAGSES